MMFAQSLKKHFWIFGFLIIFSSPAHGMLINSKEIAEDVKGAIIEAGNQVTADFKTAIETARIPWPHKHSCFAVLGFLAAFAGLLCIYRGLQKLIFLYKRDDEHLKLLGEDTYSRHRAWLSIFIGIIMSCAGMCAILMFGS